MAENERASQKFEIVEHNGRQLRKYRDGTLRDEHGRIQVSSSERGRLMQQRRKIKAMVLAGEAIQEATNSDSVEDGVRAIMKKRAEVALTDNGRAGNDAAKLVLVAAGFLQNERKVDVQGEVKHPIVPQLPREYLEYIRRKEAEVVEGKVVDENDS